MDQRLRKHQHIRDADREAMHNIFLEIVEDPSWHDESILYDVYANRIPVVDFLALIASDPEWSHLANKAQTKKILDLFDKVYGYAKGRSRLEEQNKRYKKNIAKIADVDNARAGKREGKAMLGDIFNTKEYSDRSN